nr:hypothetical protein [Paenibacillus andongensis]
MEIDEASLPVILKQILPQMLIITNFFRDQLDRYGEIDMLIKDIEKAIHPIETKMILNADDPFVFRLSNLNNALAAITCAAEFGIQDKNIKDSLHNFHLANGRMELFFYKGFPYIVNLNKNPSGMNVSLTEILSTHYEKQIVSLLMILLRMGKIFHGSGTLILNACKGKISKESFARAAEQQILRFVLNMLGLILIKLLKFHLSRKRYNMLLVNRCRHTYYQPI